MNISKEKKFIIKIIFSNQKISLNDIENIDLDKLIRQLSSHLIIPLFYVKIKTKKILSKFPKEFIKYLKFIYEINKKRNKKLLREVRILSRILDNNNIKHIYLKGSANLVSNIYEDIGERMIGDIDFLIKKKDVKKTEEVLNKNNYFSQDIHTFFNFRHLPRRINKKTLFAIEPHTELLRKPELLSVDKFFNKSKKYKEYRVPSLENSLIYNVLNFQINDFGNSRMNYSYRSIYDTVLILKKIDDLKKIKVDENIYLKNYFSTLIYFGIDIKKIRNFKENKSYMFFFKIINGNYYFKKHYITVLSGIWKTERFFYKIKVFIKDYEYRKYLKRKFIKN